MTRYGPLGLFGPPCTRWVHHPPPMRTDHPHAGPGAHASHCSNQSPGSPGGAEDGADALGGAFRSYIPPPPPSLTCCQSAVTSLNWTGGSVYLSSFSSGPRGGVVFDGGGLCWLPLRHPHARPSSSTIPGHDAPNPSTHGQQLDHPVAPPLSPEHDGSNWGQDTSQPGALWAGSDRYDNPHCPKCRHDATTCPWVRGSPLELQCFFSCFFGECKTTCLPSPGYQHQGGAPSHMPSWLPPPLHSLHRNGPMWFRNSVDPRFFPPLLKTGHPTLHTLSPPSPTGAASREVSPGTQRSCCGRVC